MQPNIEISRPSWSSVRVTRHLPGELEGLEKLCKNLWWCWNDNAKALFKYIDPDIQILQSFAGTFTDALKGKELATAQINQGADIVMNVANITGQGVMEAASEHGVYSIGVDTNQDSFYPGSVFTSMTKNVDNCTYQIIESVVNGTFEGGTATYMDLAHDGVGVTDFAVMKEALGDQFPKDIEETVNELKEKVTSGEIVVDSYEGYGKPEA